ncbi:MAG: hypothetical protein IKE75_05280 [Bacilli bacterium]|nr:hypothetical protein [Bacilli bacterium]
MEKKSTGKNITIIVLIILLIGALGYIAYDKVIVKENKEPVKTKNNIEEQTTIKTDKISISDSYVYDGEYTANPNLTAHLELKLNEDNTFLLYIGLTDAEALKGTYTLDDSKLTLYSIEADSSGYDHHVYEVNSDTFECTYDENNNTVVINKWNQHWYNSDAEKVEYEVFTSFSDLKLAKNNKFEHLGNDRFPDEKIN